MFDVLALLLAAGGGFFGAAIGGLHAFIFTGFMVLVGMAIVMAGGSPEFLNYVAFGPVFGPHIAFAGGVAAAAYAARQSKDVGGKDIGIALVSMDRPAVLLVGAVFGMFGYVVQTGVAIIPGFGSLIDSVALTVFISAIVVRLAIGRSSLSGDLPEGSGWGRFAPRDGVAWIRYHERFGQLTVLSLFVGLLAAGVALRLAEFYPAFAGSANLLMFGVSAVSLLFLSLGISFPVTHHITIIAGLGTITFLPIVGGNAVIAVLIGTICGLLSGLLGEVCARRLPQQRQHPLRPPGRRDLADDLGGEGARGSDRGRRRRRLIAAATGRGDQCTTRTSTCPVRPPSSSTSTAPSPARTTGCPPGPGRRWQISNNWACRSSSRPAAHGPTSSTSQRR